VGPDQLLLNMERQGTYPIRSVFTQPEKEIVVEMHYAMRHYNFPSFTAIPESLIQLLHLQNTRQPYVFLHFI
jgi:hypothetical protein